MDEALGMTAYEWLVLHGDPGDPATHEDILRHLACTDAPASQRAALAVLERRHFEAYLRAHRQQRRENVERVSERRLQLRERQRARWNERRAATSDPVVTIESLERTFPGLFRASKPQEASATASGELPTRTMAPPLPESDMRLHASRRQPQHVAPSVQEGEVKQPISSATSVVPSRPPHTILQQPANQSAPQRALSEMLKRKSNCDDDSDGVNLAGGLVKAHRVDAPGRNPFLTAGEKLQSDRITGKNHREDEDNRSGQVLARQTPRSGSYHPINPHLLLGGGNVGGDDDDDFDGSAIRKKFVSPVIRSGEERPPKPTPNGSSKTAPEEDDNIDPRLKSCDPELISKIEMEIVDNGDPITFDDIAGLQFAKKCVNELVIWPMARPDIFTGLRSLPKGLLLFGPPGTGKTLIGKAIASQSGATFFSISASSLTSKWIGEGEKLVRTLFAVAAVKQPSVIFIDEIDSLLTQRSSDENEASRRMKTEFLVQLDGAGTKAKDVILVVGATNRPQELDEAARRRFVKRLYIPLPSSEARLDLINRLLKDNKYDMTDEEKSDVAKRTKGYSGADVRALCTEAAMGPIRSCSDIRTMDADSVRPINLEDFEAALRGVRSSVATKDLEFYRQWNDEFGSFAFVGHED